MSEMFVDVSLWSAAKGEGKAEKHPHKSISGRAKLRAEQVEQSIRMAAAVIQLGKRGQLKLQEFLKIKIRTDGPCIRMFQLFGRPRCWPSTQNIDLCNSLCFFPSALFIASLLMNIELVFVQLNSLLDSSGTNFE
jgi:hypothetical protein